MARKPHRARRPVPRFEPLERRELLAGSLTVELLNGQLSVVGDSANNGVTILQLADFPGQVGSPPLLGNFFLKPDATTRINLLLPGQALFISGATNGVVSSLGGGPDSMLLLGRAGSSIPSVTVDSGAGDDVLSFFGGSVAQDLHVTSPGGSDRVSVTGLTVSGALTVEGTGNLDFAMQASHASDMFLKIKGVDGEATAAYLKIKLQDSLVSGFMGVDTDSSLDLSMTGGEADRVYIKGESSELEYLKITLKDALVTSFAEVQAQGSGELDFSAQGSHLEAAFLKYDGIEGAAAPRVKIDFVDVTVSSVIEVDTDGFIAMQATGQHIKKATLTVRKAGGGQQEYYSVIDLDDLFGSSVSIDSGQGLLDFSLDGGRATSVTVRGDLLLSPAALSHHVKFHNTRVTDSVVVDLTGDGLVDLVVADSQLGAAFIKFDGVDGSTAAFIKIEMEDVLVTGVVDVSTDMATDLSVTDGTLGGLALRCAAGKHIAKAVFTRVSSPDVDVEADSALDLAMIGGEVDRLSVKGESTDDFTFYKITLDDLYFSSSASLEVRGALDLGMTGVTGGQLSARSSGLGGGKVSFQDLHFSSVSLESDSAMDVVMVGGEADSLFIKGESLDPAQLYTIKLVDVLVSSFMNVDVDRSGELDLSVADSELAAIFLKMDTIPGASAAFVKVDLENVLVSGVVDVDTDGGLDFSAKGKVFQKVEIHLRSAPAGSVASRTIELEDVLVSSVSVHNDSAPLEFSMLGGQVDDVVVESESVDTVSLNFTKIKFENARVSNAMVVDVDGPLDLSSTGGEAGQVAVTRVRKQGEDPIEYLTVTMTNLLVSSYSVQDDDLQSSVSVSGGQVEGLSYKGESKDDRVHIIKLTDVLVTGVVDVDVDGDGALDVSLVDSQCDVLLLESTNTATMAGGGGGGAGKVSFSDLSFSSLHVVHDGTLFDVSATGGQTDSVAVEGTSPPDGTAQFYKVTLNDVVVSSFVDVDVDGPLDLSSSGGAAGEVSVTRVRKQGGDPIEYLTVTMTDLLVSSYSVQDDGVQRSVSVDEGQADQVLVTGEGSGPLFIIKLTDVLVSSVVAVDVDTDGVLDFSMVDSQSAQLSVDSSHPPDATGLGGGGGSGKVSMQDMHFSSVRVLDTGALVDVSVTGGQADSMSIKGESHDAAHFYTIKLTDVLISGIAVVDVDGDGALDFSALNSQCATLSLESSHPSSSAGGGGGGAGKATFQDMHFSSVRVLDSNASLDVTVTGGQGGSVDIEGISLASQTYLFLKLRMTDCIVSSYVSVDTEGSLDFSMDNSRAASLHLATGDLDGDGLEFLKITLSDLVISGLVDVDADGALDLAMDTCRAGSMSISFSAPTSSPPAVGGGSHVSMSNSRVVGRLTILGGGGDDQVTLSKLLVTGSTSISTGLGNDHLAILDSIFTGFASLNGGGGTDELAITKTTFFLNPFKLGWETIAP